MLAPHLILLLGAWVTSGTQESPANQKTVAFLKSCRHADGGYAADPKTQSSSLSATSAALRALAYFDGRPDDVEKTKAYVWSCYRRDSGRFADRPAGQPGYRPTVSGIFAVVALQEKFKPADLSRLQESLWDSINIDDLRLGAAGLEALVLDGQLTKVPQEWHQHLTRTFRKELQPDGTYGQGSTHARTTAGLTAAFLRLGFPVPERGRVTDTLLKEQHPSGGWLNDQGQPDLESTYRVMRCLYLLRMKDRGMLEKCRRFLDSCRKPEGGYGNLSGSAGVSTTYFAGSVLHWIEELGR